jgi:hypothetical protein
MNKRLILGLCLMTAGCSTTEGLIQAPPPVTSLNPASITVCRATSPEGAIAPLIFTINGEKIYGLRPGESYSFRLDPGSYTFGWYLALNTCSQAVWIQPGDNISLTLGPTCDISPQPQ